MGRDRALYSPVSFGAGARMRKVVVVVALLLAVSTGSAFARKAPHRAAAPLTAAEAISRGIAPPTDDDILRDAAPELPQQANQGADQCWMDYCPCAEDGPLDLGICRDMRAGLRVDVTDLSVAAKVRDTRRYMEKWNRDHPDNQIPVQH